eukprot:6431956-Ditylum_brightwellii.AAC.1
MITKPSYKDAKKENLAESGQPAQAIRNRMAIAVSDGLAKDGWSAVAATIQGLKYNKKAVYTECMSSGAAEDQDTYKKEFSGLYSIVCGVEQLRVRHKITTGEITVGYNGIEPFKKAMDEDTTYLCCLAQFSLISVIDNKLEMSPLNWR